MSSIADIIRARCEPADYGQMKAMIAQREMIIIDLELRLKHVFNNFDAARREATHMHYQCNHYREFLTAILHTTSLKHAKAIASEGLRTGVVK